MMRFKLNKCSGLGGGSRGSVYRKGGVTRVQLVYKDSLNRETDTTENNTFPEIIGGLKSKTTYPQD